MVDPRTSKRLDISTDNIFEPSIQVNNLAENEVSVSAYPSNPSQGTHRGVKIQVPTLHISKPEGAEHRFCRARVGCDCDITQMITGMVSRSNGSKGQHS